MNKILKFIEEKSVDEGFLQDWYQHSVDDTKEPIWTDKHISEVHGDFYLIPRESVEKISKVLFRHNEDWEHIIVYRNGILLSDGIENHRLSALEILEELDRLGIIELESEVINDGDD